MGLLKIVAIALIVLGLIALAYGGFSYIRTSNSVDLGPVEFSVRQRENVAIPVWMGVGAVIAGCIVLIIPFKKST